MSNSNPIGVVLAGGKSSRMGENKAFLSYKGEMLIDRMISVLAKTGLTDIYVSGDFEGYRCIPDEAPHKGPAYAMRQILSQLNHDAGVLFIPVDMPFMKPDMLQYLVNQEEGGYFDNFYLPAFVKNNDCDEIVNSVKDFLKLTRTSSISILDKWRNDMINANTTTEWQEVLRK